MKKKILQIGCAGLISLLTLSCPIQTGDLVFHHSSDRIYQTNQKIDVQENVVETVATPIVDDTRDDVTEEKIDLLARLITAEQGYVTSYEIGSAKYDEILENYYLCGSVVINRINSPLYPDTLHEVINQIGQYSVVPSGAINKPYDDVAWEIAEELLVYGTEIPSNVLGQSQFRQMDGVYRQVGNQIYSYLGE